MRAAGREWEPEPPQNQQRPNARVIRESFRLEPPHQRHGMSGRRQTSNQ
jgi:hypothetical protein